MSSKQTAIITGASGGIGAGLVEGFLEEGYNVVATSREAHRDLTTSLPLVWRRLFTPLTYHKGRRIWAPGLIRAQRDYRRLGSEIRKFA
jgi:NAD(P)-dependent dehydrogenase (short-subunit alcohol dehydrogenase family)